MGRCWPVRCSSEVCSFLGGNDAGERRSTPALINGVEVQTLQPPTPQVHFSLIICWIRRLRVCLPPSDSREPAGRLQITAILRLGTLAIPLSLLHPRSIHTWSPPLAPRHLVASIVPFNTILSRSPPPLSLRALRDLARASSSLLPHRTDIVRAGNSPLRS